MIRLWLATLSFMSRLPVPARWTSSLAVEQYVRGIITFPFVGWLLGSLSGGVFVVLQPFWGGPLAAFAAVLALALLTGGFHLDGLADTCDGIFSARTRQRMLEIMRDSRLGTHGGLALIFVLLGKVLVISELALRDQPPLMMLTAASISGRSLVVLLMYRQRYAREEGLGNLYIGKISTMQTLVTLLLGAALVTLLCHMAGLRAFVISAVAIYLLAWALRRTLGGQTGDTLGAAIELGELIFLLALL